MALACPVYCTVTPDSRRAGCLNIYHATLLFFLFKIICNISNVLLSCNIIIHRYQVHCNNQQIPCPRNIRYNAKILQILHFIATHGVFVNDLHDRLLVPADLGPVRPAQPLPSPPATSPRARRSRASAAARRVSPPLLSQPSPHSKGVGEGRFGVQGRSSVAFEDECSRGCQRVLRQQESFLNTSQKTLLPMD